MKLFTRKTKGGKPSREFAEEAASKPPIATPLYHKMATHGWPHPQPPPPTPPKVDEPWEVVQQPSDSPPLPNPHPLQHFANGPSRTSSFNSGSLAPSQPLPSPLPPPRSASPMSNMSTPTNKLIRHHDRDRDARKRPPANAPVALGILRALDPPRPPEGAPLQPSHSEERFSESSHQPYAGRESLDKTREKRSFWGGRDKEKERKDKETVHREREREPAHDRDRERGREPRRDDDSQAELTRMIGYLTATASEDWSLVLEVCDRASSSENNAKEAVRAIRREFKYGEPPAQLSAARLWAIMLRNCSDVFISQSRTRKFLETLEELLISSKTSPVVRERLLEVVAAAAYASGSNPRHERDGFRGLWRRVKPFDKPDEGVPFDTDDAMFQPPASAGVRTSGYEVPLVSYQEPSPVASDSAVLSPTPTVVPVKKKSPARNRIIPPDEDIRRLFQECKIGQGNASLLSQALTLSKPEEMKKKEVIKEFVMRCRSSQELIFAQIPWASAGAERSRAEKDSQTKQIPKEDALGLSEGLDVQAELTIEEQLLAALLGANAELIESLRQYEDMERIARERKIEERSKRELRREIRNREQSTVEQSIVHGRNGGSSSRSPSPAPRRSRSRSPHHTTIVHRHQHTNSHSQSHHSHQLSESDIDHTMPPSGLAPPPAAPHGPRSPAQISLHSRTPSPTPRIDPYVYSNNIGGANGHKHDYTDHSALYANHDEETDEEDYTPVKPSAKALGKRKLVEPEVPSPGPDVAAFDPDDIYDDRDPSYAQGNGTDPDFDDDADNRWRHPPQQFVYDALADRTRQLMAASVQSTPLTNGSH